MSKCAFERGFDCCALNTKQCVGCPFIKTEEELRKGRMESAKRILNLPKKKRWKILRKYHDSGRDFGQWLR